jgi:hypothetical protein
MKFGDTKNFFFLLFLYESCSLKFEVGVAGWGSRYMISLKANEEYLQFAFSFESCMYICQEQLIIHYPKWRNTACLQFNNDNIIHSSENVLQRIAKEKKFPELTAEKVKLKKILFVLRILLSS